ncbi:sporulation protein YunB [Bacillus massilinigeriensis]|uniref:sporulation protein YunB n=1 Tax=Bacillus mediterraneensis TaxID=1805474 RepID=UPI0008F8988D|nr:sporulation protein YunB [Bacillus mediterraneensis]
MRIRKRRGRKGPLTLNQIFIITFITFTVCTFQSLWLINKFIEPVLISVAETKARQFAALAINDAISTEIAGNIDMTELIIIHKNNGAIGYSFNPKIYNRVIYDASKRVQHNLDKIVETLPEEKIGTNDTNNGEKIVYYIPLGMATNNTLFMNMGPKVPVKFEILGNVVSDVETRIKQTGINNTFLEIYVKVAVQMNVVIPLVEKQVEISNSVKIGDLFLQGEVPQYYNGNNRDKSDVNPIVVPESNKKTPAN